MLPLYLRCKEGGGAMSGRSLLLRSLVCCAGLLGTQFAIAEPSSQLTLTSGVEYSSGDYGGADSLDEVYVPVNVRYRTRDYSVGVTVPYLWVKAPEFDSGSGAVPASAQTKAESGAGDVILSGTLYDVWAPEAKPIALDLSARYKFGVADEDKGLGTGEDDVTLYANLYRWFDRLSLMASAGYRFRGDPPAVNLDNSWVLSLAANYCFSAYTCGGLVYDFREASIPGIDDPTELTALMSWRPGARWRFSGYVFTGLSDSSADWGSGLLIELTL